MVALWAEWTSVPVVRGEGEEGRGGSVSCAFREVAVYSRIKTMKTTM